MKDEKKFKKYLGVVQDLLSQVLGTDQTDIQVEDSLTEDLCMGPAEMADLIQLMNQKGFDVNESIFGEEVNNVGELVDYLIDNEEV